MPNSDGATACARKQRDATVTVAGTPPHLRCDTRGSLDRTIQPPGAAGSDRDSQCGVTRLSQSRSESMRLQLRFQVKFVTDGLRRGLTFQLWIGKVDG